jgi:hypothetical protein
MIVAPPGAMLWSSYVCLLGNVSRLREYTKAAFGVVLSPMILSGPRQFVTPRIGQHGAGRVGCMPSQAQNPGEDSSTHYQELVELTVQASLACITSGCRYWQRVAELYGSYALTVSRDLSDMQAASDSREEAWGSFREHLRAYVRTLGDLTRQESRLLQSELETIERNIWPAAESAHIPPHWRRRVRAKL